MTKEYNKTEIKEMSRDASAVKWACQQFVHAGRDINTRIDVVSYANERMMSILSDGRGNSDVYVRGGMKDGSNSLYDDGVQTYRVMRTLKDAASNVKSSYKVSKLEAPAAGTVSELRLSDFPEKGATPSCSRSTRAKACSTAFCWTRAPTTPAACSTCPTSRTAVRRPSR